MNKKQVVWASQHDWFVSFKLLDAEASKYEVVCRSDVMAGVNVRFDSFKELKEWAGY